MTRLFEISLDIFLPICAGFLLLAMVGCDNGNVPGHVSFDAATAAARWYREGRTWCMCRHSLTS